MKKSTWKLMAVLSVIISVITLLFHWQWTLGFLFGDGMAVILFLRNASFWSDRLDEKEVRGFSCIMHFFLNVILMAVPMLAGAIYPQYFNIFTAALGLLMIKITVYVESIFLKGGDED